MSYLDIKSFEAADEHSAEKEANLEDQVAKLSMMNAESERMLDQTNSENNTLRKNIDELEQLSDTLRQERDVATKNLEETMRELGEIA